MRLTVLFCFLVIGLQAQFPKYDYIWMFGGDAPFTDTLFGGTMINFARNDLQIDRKRIRFNYNITNGAMSDSDGSFLYHTNGVEIHNAKFQMMKNGDNLNPDPYRQQVESSGYNLYQGVLPLVVEDTYYLIHAERIWGSPNNPYLGTHVPHLMYSTIDMNGDNGLGEVIIKNEIIFSDTLDYGKIVATQHANGRDWWIIVAEFNLDQYYKALLTPDGVKSVSSQMIGDSLFGGLGQAHFSPDGSKYATITTQGPNFGGVYLNVFDFDRCNGELSNYQGVRMPIVSGNSAGLCFSPNSRFLYVFESIYIFQYDLLADSIAASIDTVAINDGFRSPRTGFGTPFFLGQLGPDNKIYISVGNFSSEYLHVIHNPDEKGKACNVEQHGIELPRLNNFGIPNFPNYRLGPIDGSPCDTLGIDNLPAAHFRYTADTTDPLTIHFTDLSYYEPTDWDWDFGDASGQSRERHPSYTFASPGVYEVCLEVQNGNGESTACQTLFLGVTSNVDVLLKNKLSIYPNPTTGQLMIDTKLFYVNQKTVHVYDLLGKQMIQAPLQDDLTTISMGHLAKGMYFVEIRVKGQRVGVEKVVVE